MVSIILRCCPVPFAGSVSLDFSSNVPLIKNTTHSHGQTWSNYLGNGYALQVVCLCAPHSLKWRLVVRSLDCLVISGQKNRWLYWQSDWMDDHRRPLDTAKQPHGHSRNTRPTDRPRLQRAGSCLDYRSSVCLVLPTTNHQWEHW